MTTSAIIEIIKGELKKSKISYSDLAKDLKITEAGVKKLFTRGNLSMERAFQICKVLNISLADLIFSASETKQAERRFTDKQINFLAKNPHYFHFYMKLLSEQVSPSQIQEEHNLSLRSLNTYLKKLEELGLIRRHPTDRVQILGGIPAAVSIKGTGLENTKFEMIEELIQQHKKTDQGVLAGAGLYLTSDESDEMKSRIAEVLREYSFLSHRNRKSRNKNASSTSVMYVEAPVSMFNKIREI